MLAARKLTQARLKELTTYDPETGVFTRNTSICQYPAGSAMGHTALTRGKYYVRIRVDGELIMAHALAWLYVYGEWPKDELDHINGDGTDNRLANLRPADRLVNNQNTAKRKGNKTGYPGVHLQPNGRYQTILKHNKVTHYLGTFAKLEDAAAAIAAKRLEFGFGENHTKEKHTLNRETT